MRTLTWFWTVNDDDKIADDKSEERTWQVYQQNSW